MVDLQVRRQAGVEFAGLQGLARRSVLPLSATYRHLRKASDRFIFFR